MRTFEDRTTYQRDEDGRRPDQNIPMRTAEDRTKNLPVRTAECQTRKFPMRTAEGQTRNFPMRMAEGRTIYQPGLNPALAGEGPGGMDPI